MKHFFLSFFLLLSVSVFAQMQVWSNGTIVFSHDVSTLDSIS